MGELKFFSHRAAQIPQNEPIQRYPYGIMRWNHAVEFQAGLKFRIF